MINILPQLLVNGIIAGSIYAVIAMGYGMVYGILKFPNFAHGAVAMIGGYLTLALTSGILHIPFWIAGLVAIALTAGLGVLVELVAYRPIRNQFKLGTMVSAMAVSLILEAVVILATQGRFKLYDLPIARGINIGPITLTQVHIFILAASLLLMVGMRVLLYHTKLGKAMRAISDEPTLAELSGINSDFVSSCVFAAGAICGSTAGILYAMDTALVPSMGMSMTIKSFAAVILGGLGSMEGSVIGGLLLGVGENIGVLFLPAVWKDTIAFLIMTIGLYIKPTGFFGKKEDVVFA